MRPQAQFPLALELRSPAGARLRDVFQFMSGLYFRGKLAYSDRFARPPAGGSGALVIVPGAGLVSPEERVGLEALRAFAEVPVDVKDARYRIPLERDARRLARRLGRNGEAVLLGSIASGKYTEVLLTIFRERLRFPTVFVGRGDMSRGGLMLRCARASIEMEYAAVGGAVVHGERPPRLPPIPRRDWSAATVAEAPGASRPQGDPSTPLRYARGERMAESAPRAVGKAISRAPPAAVPSGAEGPTSRAPRAPAETTAPRRR